MISLKNSQISCIFHAKELQPPLKALFEEIFQYFYLTSIISQARGNLLIFQQKRNERFFIIRRNQLSHLLFLFQLTVIFQYQVLKCISQNNYFNLFFIDTNLILAALKGLSVQLQELINKQDAQDALLQAIPTKVGLSSSKDLLPKII